MTDFENRQNWDLNAWPEMYGTLKQLQALVFLSPPGLELNLLVFTMSSLAAGCRHCQAHGAYGLDRERRSVRVATLGGIARSQNLPELTHSASGGTTSVLSQCSTTLPGSSRKMSTWATGVPARRALHRVPTKCPSPTSSTISS